MVLNTLWLDAKLGKFGGFCPSFLLLGALSGNWHSSASFGAEATSCGKVLTTSVDIRRRK